MSSEWTLTRRDFVKVGGVLAASVIVPSAFGVPCVGAAVTTLDPSSLKSWLEIHADGSIIARTGRTETGTSASAFYAQVIAEELDVSAASVSLIMGHTDETPDGGFSAGFLHGVTNLRKVSAYTRQALLKLAAVKLDVPEETLTVKDGVVTGNGAHVSYGDLLTGQRLDLTISVDGAMPTIDPTNAVGMAGLGGITVKEDPPTKAVSTYSVVGTSYERPGMRDIVMGKPVYSSDVALPGMLHARMVRPSTIGARLQSVGRLDRSRFPTAEVVVKENLVAVVSPNEWEAVQAARTVGRATQWTSWSGLPGSDNVMETLRASEWTLVGRKGDQEKVEAALASATRVVSGTYEGPYVRCAPIGAYVAVADVRSDGTATIWAQSAHPQGARANVANTLGVPFDNVTIRWAEGPGQYGRTTLGGDGAMADAAIVSQLLGKPVRVEWTLAEDLTWSSVSPPWYADVKAGLDARGNLVAFKSDWYGGHENDARMLGAILAGMPTLTPGPTQAYGAALATVWPYDKTPALEQAFFTDNVASDAAGGGLRGNMMRTPQQRQQNVALEGIITEAAAAAGADPIEFRIRHTTDAVYAGVLRAVAEAHGWKSRPSPSPVAARTGSTPITGRGVGVVLRQGAPWVAIADVEVKPSTGDVKLTAFTVGIDVGKVMNPRHLKSMLQGGVVMGIGEALFEEVTFDESKVTSNDWNRYRIPHMKDIPDIQTVFVSRDDRGMNGGGEAANAVAPPAIMAAFFDATGVMPRRIPLTPAYVQVLLGRDSTDSV